MQIIENVGFADEIDQGDVFTNIFFPAIDTNVTAVLITPTCDIAQGKSSFLKFISAIPCYAVIQRIADGLTISEEELRSGDPLKPKQIKNLIKGIRSNANGNYLPRYYLFPEFSNVVPNSYLDFQRVFVIPYIQVKEEYLDNRVGRVMSPWREDMVARHSGYSMRVGTPRYPEDVFKNVITASGLKIE